MAEEGLDRSLMKELAGLGAPADETLVVAEAWLMKLFFSFVILIFAGFHNDLLEAISALRVASEKVKPITLLLLALVLWIFLMMKSGRF